MTMFGSGDPSFKVETVIKLKDIYEQIEKIKGSENNHYTYILRRLKAIDDFLSELEIEEGENYQSENSDIPETIYSQGNR